MLMVVATPFSSLLMVFAAVPLGILIGIYGREGAAALLKPRERRRSPSPRLREDGARQGG